MTRKTECSYCCGIPRSGDGATDRVFHPRGRREESLSFLKASIISVLVIVAAGILASSCSVKEDRSDCACILEMDLSDVRVQDLELRGWMTEKLGVIFDEFVIPSSLEGERMVEIPVPRGEVQVSSIWGRNRMRERMNSLEILPLNQMDSIFAHSSLVDTKGERARDRVQLLKNFATVHVRFRGKVPGLDDSFDLLVRGNVSGIEIRTLAPIQGEFLCRTDIDPEGGYMFRVPRQVDDTLQLELYTDGLLVESVDIGRIIRMGGFDWDSPSLGDVKIEADIPKGEFTVTVLEWRGPSIMTVTI